MVKANANMCSEGKAIRDTDGRFIRWNRVVHKISVKSDVRDTSVAEYRMFEFDGRGKQASDVQCVFFKGDSAKTFSRSFQSLYKGQRGSGFVGQQSVVKSSVTGFESYFCMQLENDTKIYCNFGGSGVICTPVIMATESALGSEAIRVQPKLLFENGAVDCVFVGGGYGTDAPGPEATTPPGASSDGGSMTYYEPPSGSFGGTLAGCLYQYEPPNGVNCELGGCGNGGGQPCYATDRTPTIGLFSAITECTCPAGQAYSNGNCVEDLDQVPNGWDASDYDNLTRGEKRLVWSDPIKWYGRRGSMTFIRDQAYALSLDYTQTTVRADGTRQNAYQHAIWSALMSRAYGFNDAKAWTDAHEDLGWELSEQEIRARDMDLHNNAIGLAFAGTTGSSGSALQDVIEAESGLCWLIGTDSTSSCTPP